MGLTLIQEQVLEALVDAQEAPDRPVRPAAVRERLKLRRPRVTSEKYVRLILRDLEGQRLDGLPLIERRVVSRGAVAYLPLNAARDLVERRQP